MVAAAIGGLAGFFFSDDEIVDLSGAQSTDAEVYGRFFRGMLAHGIYVPPSRFEALFIGTAHEKEHVEQFLEAAEDVLPRLSQPPGSLSGPGG
jgi:glutamate-1-semialdehyde 2,1-aminomutase